jgi:hypothetical protein
MEAGWTLARFPAGWNRPAEKKSRRFIMLNTAAKRPAQQCCTGPELQNFAIAQF